MVYTLTLNPAIDCVVQLDYPLTPGTVNRSKQDTCQFGGKGINVSNVLHTLGVDTVALGFIAGFTGEGLENGLQDMGLQTRFLRLAHGNTRINMKIRGREETEINGRGPSITPSDMTALYAQLDTLEAGDVLVLSGSVPAGLSADTYACILQRLQKKNISCVVDASGALLQNTLAYHPFLIKPNKAELEALFDTTLNSDQQIMLHAQKLQQLGAQNVLISLAGDGALLLDNRGLIHRRYCPAGTVVNSVGAGDAMVAGFLAGYLQSRSYDHALQLGIAAGSATAFSLGLATRERIEALL